MFHTVMAQHWLCGSELTFSSVWTRIDTCIYTMPVRPIWKNTPQR